VYIWYCLDNLTGIWGLGGWDKQLAEKYCVGTMESEPRKKIECYTQAELAFYM
jgi:anti-sigma-K factor RskA